MRRKPSACGLSFAEQNQAVTVKTRDAAINLLGRLFREEEFATPLSRIAENFDRMLADPLCWSALASDGEAAQAVITCLRRMGSFGRDR